MLIKRAASLLGICALLMLGALSPRVADAWVHGHQLGSPPPVITNASLSFNTPVTNGATVGTLSATGSPTSWAITAGNGSGGFAISNAGVITITTGSIFGTTSGSTILTVTATNAFGTGTNPNIIINWTPSGSAPVINTASLSFQTPTTNGATVGTLTASGSPTSWAITGGNPGGGTGFAISNSGVITIATASVFGTTSGSATLTVTATNVFGTGTNSNIAITWTQSGSAPVIANASFAFTTPATTGAVVGTLSATGSPTTWFITAGNTICGFAIDNNGVITITTGSLFGSGSGSETLTVTATNSFGTGSNSNIVISWAPSGAAPVITTASFSITTPVTSGGNVGTLSATGSPTSWAITAGDPSGNFAISNSGVITTTAAAVTNLGTNSGSQTLTVTATNGFGTGSNSNIIVNYAPFNPGSCSNTTVANIPFGSFTAANQQSTGNGFSANIDGSTGFFSANFGILGSSFNAPNSCVYIFTVNAYETANPGVTGQNNLQVLVDGQPIPAGPTPAVTTTNYWVQFVTNCCTGPAVGYQFNVPLQAGYHNVNVGFNSAQSATLTAATMGLHGERLIITETTTPTPTEPSGSRNPWNFPFSSNHFINSAIGTGAIWSSGTTTADLCLQAGGGGGNNSCPGTTNGGKGTQVNYNNSFNDAFNQGLSTDPIGTITYTSTVLQSFQFNGTNPLSLHMSESSFVPQGSDFSAVFGDATNLRYIYSGSNNTSFNAGPPPSVIATGYGGVADAYDQNSAIGSVAQVYGGYIRVADLAAGVIAHTLELGTQYSQMQEPPNSLTGLGFPVVLADFPCVTSPTLCTGSMPWGATVGIPSVAKGGPNCNNLGLSVPYGVMLCTALQNYGAVHSINSGNANTPVNTLIGECIPLNGGCSGTPAAFPSYQSAMAAIATAWGSSAIQSNLRIMTNQTPANFYTGDGVRTCASGGCAKGGGAPLVPPLPGVMSGLASINITPPPPATQTPFLISPFHFGGASGGTITTTVDAPQHSTIIVFLYGDNSTNASFSSVALSNGSPCSISASATNSSLTTAAIATCVNISSDLAISSTITVNGSFGSGSWSGVVYAATGVTGGVDKTATITTSSGAFGVTLTGPTLSQANELVCSDFSGVVGANFGTITERYNSVFSTELASPPYYGAACNVVSSTTAPIYNPTWTLSSTTAAAAMVTLKIP